MIHSNLQPHKGSSWNWLHGERFTLALAAHEKLLHIIILLHECLGFLRPCCGEGGGALTLSMCLCVGVRRNKQLFLYSYLPQCRSSFLTGGWGECKELISVFTSNKLCVLFCFFPFGTNGAASRIKSFLNLKCSSCQLHDEELVLLFCMWSSNTVSVWLEQISSTCRVKL